MRTPAGSSETGPRTVLLVPSTVKLMLKPAEHEEAACSICDSDAAKMQELVKGQPKGVLCFG